MCYAKPGPRCSKHAKSALNSAFKRMENHRKEYADATDPKKKQELKLKVKKSTERYEEAVEDFRYTPAGAEATYTAVFNQYAPTMGEDQARSIAMRTKENILAERRRMIIAAKNLKAVNLKVVAKNLKAQEKKQKGEPTAEERQTSKRRSEAAKKATQTRVAAQEEKKRIATGVDEIRRVQVENELERFKQTEIGGQFDQSSFVMSRHGGEHAARAIVEDDFIYRGVQFKRGEEVVITTPSHSEGEYIQHVL